MNHVQLFIAAIEECEYDEARAQLEHLIKNLQKGIIPKAEPADWEFILSELRDRLPQ
jgi:hypothetical protein